jgi:hypothetical protein
LEALAANPDVSEHVGVLEAVDCHADEAVPTATYGFANKGARDLSSGAREVQVAPK